VGFFVSGRSLVMHENLVHSPIVPEPLHVPYNRLIMSKNLSPLESESATTDEAEAYDRWFRQKVQRSLDDRRPPASHDEVMAALRKIIEAKRDINASDPMAN
jgi:hypothetical protein